MLFVNLFSGASYFCFCDKNYILNGRKRQILTLLPFYEPNHPEPISSNWRNPNATAMPYGITSQTNLNPPPPSSSKHPFFPTLMNSVPLLINIYDADTNALNVKLLKHLLDSNRVPIHNDVFFFQYVHRQPLAAITVGERY